MDKVIIINAQSEIPIEFQPLAEEARKYKNIEDFLKAIDEKVMDTAFDAPIRDKATDLAGIMKIHSSSEKEYFRKLTNIYTQAVKQSFSQNISYNPKENADSYKRDYYFTTIREKQERRTPSKNKLWDRESMPEESGDGYNMSNRFQDSDKAIAGPLP